MARVVEPLKLLQCSATYSTPKDCDLDFVYPELLINFQVGRGFNPFDHRGLEVVLTWTASVALLKFCFIRASMYYVCVFVILSYLVQPLP